MLKALATGADNHDGQQRRRGDGRRDYARIDQTTSQQKAAIKALNNDLNMLCT